MASYNYRRNDSNCFAMQSILAERANIRQVVISAGAQLPVKLNHRERLEWLQRRRGVGTWVQCSRHVCCKWRYLSDVKDPVNVPSEWFCYMNSDSRLANCNSAEIPPLISADEDLIYTNYTAGSVVWARMGGFPWWPGLVDDCPDTEQYYWINNPNEHPTHYNVVFFDVRVTRAWIPSSQVQPFNGDSMQQFSMKVGKVDYSQRIIYAIQQASSAIKFDIPERLQKYGFLERFKGVIKKPIDVLDSYISDTPMNKKETPKPKKSLPEHKLTDTPSPAEKSITNIYRKLKKKHKDNQLKLRNRKSVSSTCSDNRHSLKTHGSTVHRLTTKQTSPKTRNTKQSPSKHKNSTVKSPSKRASRKGKPRRRSFTKSDKDMTEIMQKPKRSPSPTGICVPQIIRPKPERLCIPESQIIEHISSELVVRTNVRVMSFRSVQHTAIAGPNLEILSKDTNRTNVNEANNNGSVEVVESSPELFSSQEVREASQVYPVAPGANHGTTITDSIHDDTDEEKERRANESQHNFNDNSIINNPPTELDQRPAEELLFALEE